MNREVKLTSLELILLIFFMLLGFVLVLRQVEYQSVNYVEPVDISYILSTIQEPTELPFGGREIFPDYRYVALYGSPLYDALGILGEQSVDASIARAKKLAAKYQPHSQEKIIPTMEIITTIASATPTENGDYSQETDISKLAQWVAKAYDNGMYVLLDLQPGRSSFVTQVKQYKELLMQPHVGLALDPEWRLGSNQFHLQQIGSVSVNEVNEVANWLADLTAEAELPQKMFLIHQFKLSMIQGRDKLDTSREELAYVIQMDGQGTKAGKLDTYSAVTANAPKNVYFGWKNFYDEDSKLFSPKETMALKPKPWYVSYQ